MRITARELRRLGLDPPTRAEKRLAEIRFAQRFPVADVVRARVAQPPISFRALGLPKPQPRPRFNAKTGRVYNPGTAAKWRESVAWAAGLAMKGHGPFAGPVAVTLAFTLPDDRLADLDNLCKSTLDALVEAGVMLNDNAVVDLHATKAIGPDTGCDVTVAAKGQQP